MAVVYIDNDASTGVLQAYCEWFVGNDSHHDYFAVINLTKDDPEA